MEKSLAKRKGCGSEVNIELDTLEKGHFVDRKTPVLFATNENGLCLRQFQKTEGGGGDYKVSFCDLEKWVSSQFVVIIKLLIDDPFIIVHYRI